MPSRRLIPFALLCFVTLAAGAQEPAPGPKGSETPQEKRALVDIRMPLKGMTMNDVENEYGAPLSKMPAVGEPPITRWVYADYTVYFEYSEVIHSVINESRPAQP